MTAPALMRPDPDAKRPPKPQSRAAQIRKLPIKTPSRVFGNIQEMEVVVDAERRCKRLGIQPLVAQQHKFPANNVNYIPDMILPSGLVIEVKSGRPSKAVWRKMEAVARRTPDLVLRFVLVDRAVKGKSWGHRVLDNWVYWLDRHGYEYALGRIPDRWLTEQFPPSVLAAVERFRRHVDDPWDAGFNLWHTGRVP